MSMIPELVKNLGPEAFLIGIGILVVSGVSIAWIFSQFALKLVEKMMRDAGRQANARQDAYEHGRRDAEDSSTRKTRTPSEGTRTR